MPPRISCRRRARRPPSTPRHRGSAGDAAFPRAALRPPRAEGVLAEQAALLVGLGQRGRQRRGRHSPGAELRVERVERRLQRRGTGGRLWPPAASRASRESRCPACRRGRPAVRDSRRSPPWRNRRACRNGPARPAGSSRLAGAGVRHPRRKAGRGCRRSSSSPGSSCSASRGAASGRSRSRACNCRGCASHPGPSHQNRRGTRMKALVSLQPSCRNFTPAWASSVGITQEWLGTSVIFAPMGSGRPYCRESRVAIAQPAHQVLQVLGLGVRGERQRVEGDGALAHRLFDARPAGRFLLRTEHVRQRPAGQRPGEPLLRRQIARGLHHLERAVHHVDAILLEHLLDACRCSRCRDAS